MYLNIKPSVLRESCLEACLVAAGVKYCTVGKLGEHFLKIMSLQDSFVADCELGCVGVLLLYS